MFAGRKGTRVEDAQRQKKQSCIYAAMVRTTLSEQLSSMML